MVPAGSRLLGLDIGERTIGLALSDTGRMIATPHSTLRRSKFTVEAAQLRLLISELNIGGFVIGLPLHVGGDEGKRCQSVRQFARNLLKLYDIPILFHDERFSTSIVEEALHEAELSHKKRKAVVDKMAASYILQGVLDVHPR